jgi:hypothetical protein
MMPDISSCPTDEVLIRAKTCIGRCRSRVEQMKVSVFIAKSDQAAAASRRGAVEYPIDWKWTSAEESIVSKRPLAELTWIKNSRRVRLYCVLSVASKLGLIARFSEYSHVTVATFFFILAWDNSCRGATTSGGVT